MLKFFFKKSYSRYVEPEAFALCSSLMSYGCLSQIVWAPEKNTELCCWFFSAMESKNNYPSLGPTKRK